MQLLVFEVSVKLSSGCRRAKGQPFIDVRPSDRWHIYLAPSAATDRILNTGSLIIHRNLDIPSSRHLDKYEMLF